MRLHNHFFRFERGFLIINRPVTSPVIRLSRMNFFHSFIYGELLANSFTHWDDPISVSRDS